MICPTCGEQVRIESGRCNHCDHTINFAEKLNSFPALPDPGGLQMLWGVATPATGQTECVEQIIQVEKLEDKKGLRQLLRSIIQRRKRDD